MPGEGRTQVHSHRARRYRTSSAKPSCVLPISPTPDWDVCVPFPQAGGARSVQFDRLTVQALSKHRRHIERN